jgi:transcriptional regulator with XRE-family HTH domain
MTERRPRLDYNPLRAFLAQDGAPTQREFARAVGVSEPYLSQLIADGAPWPSRDVLMRIAIVTRGVVDPNAWCGWPPAPDDNRDWGGQARKRRKGSATRTFLEVEP